MIYRMPMTPVRYEVSSCGVLRRTTYHLDTAQGRAECVRIVAGDLDDLRNNEEWHVRATRLLSEPSRLPEIDAVATRWLGHEPGWVVLDEVADLPGVKHYSANGIHPPL